MWLLSTPSIIEKPIIKLNSNDQRSSETCNRSFLCLLYFSSILTMPSVCRHHYQVDKFLINLSSFIYKEFILIRYKSVCNVFVFLYWMTRARVKCWLQEWLICWFRNFYLRTYLNMPIKVILSIPLVIAKSQKYLLILEINYKWKCEHFYEWLT